MVKGKVVTVVSCLLSPLFAVMPAFSASLSAGQPPAVMSETQQKAVTELKDLLANNPESAEALKLQAQNQEKIQIMVAKYAKQNDIKLSTKLGNSKTLVLSDSNAVYMMQEGSKKVETVYDKELATNVAGVSGGKMIVETICTTVIILAIGTGMFQLFKYMIIYG
ncbi:MAG: hypothetical protein PHW69_07905 [Elusimicrobiaceae bacterium]|nr:hypothetical protein [Elusimicrobiaceae bacterium]